MCGIAGIIDFHRTFPEERLDNMLLSMIKRGPDHTGKACSGHYKIGMNRLSIIDLGTGNQPIYNEKKTIFTVLNGEIYNYVELRADLEKKGYKFKTKTDTEVLVHLYEDIGPNLIHKLNGMFSFCIADLENNIFYIFRDHYGIKPLYYYYVSGTFVFASEAKAILKSGIIKTGLNTNSIAKYLQYSYIPSPKTAFDNIFKLEAGNQLKFDRNGLKKEKWYDINKYCNTENNTISKRLIIEELKSLFASSIKLQMRSDVPLGVSLSGGLDSSLLTALAVRETNLNVNTFSIGFEDSEFDELNYANIISQKFETNHHEIIVNSQDTLNHLDKIMWYMDEPIGDSAVLPSYLLSKFASKHVKVILSGLGGDELFGGYQRYSLKKSKFRIFRFIPKKIRSEIFSPLLGIINKGWGREIDLIDKNLTEALKFYKKSRKFSTQVIADLLQSHTIENSDSNQIVDMFNKYPGNDILNNMMYTDINLYMNDQLLHLTDRVTMATSLEARVPFLDNRIVEFSLGLSANHKINNHEFKVILKQAYQDLMPSEILKRKKWGFAAPDNSWTLNNRLNEPINNCLEGTLISDGLVEKEYFIKFLTDSNLRREYSSWIWQLIALESWYSQYRTFF